MMPDTKVETLKMVLDLSITGQVSLASQTVVTEVMSLISSLGMQAKLTIVSETGKGVEEKINKAIDGHVVKIIDRPDCNVSPKQEYSEDNSPERDGNVFVAINDSAMQKVEAIYDCENVNPLAMDHSTFSGTPMDIIGNTSRAKGHDTLARDSDSDDLRFDGNEDVEGTNEDIGEKQVDLVDLTLTTEPEYLVPSKGSNVSPAKQKIKCLLCGQLFTTKSQLMRHMSRTHYTKQLMSLFGSDTSQCPVCNYRFPSNCQLNKTGHLGATHNKILVVAHPTVKAQLDSLQSSDDLPKKEKHGTISKIERGHKKKRPAICIICPICSASFDTPTHLRRHLCRIHFKEEIFHEANVTDDCLKCPACGRTVNKRLKGSIGEMAVHLGTYSHGYLDKVLPKNVKAALEDMEGRKKGNSRRRIKEIY